MTWMSNVFSNLPFKVNGTQLRKFLDECLDRKNLEPVEFLSEVISPALTRIEACRREDRATAAAIAIVMSSLRLAAGRVIERMADTPNVDLEHGRRILLFCGQGAAEQLDAEIMTAEVGDGRTRGSFRRKQRSER